MFRRRLLLLLAVGGLLCALLFGGPRVAARLVVCMAPFSERARARSLRLLQSLPHGLYDRWLVSIPVVRRFGRAPSEPSVDAVLDVYGRALGAALAPVSAAHDNDSFHGARLYVQFLQEDWGAATGVLGALRVETAPDTLLLALDADAVYPPSLFGMVRQRAPSDAVLGAVCQRASIVAPDAPPPCRDDGWLAEGWTAYRVGLLTEAGPHFLFARARNLSHACFLHDGVWLSAALRARGVRLEALAWAPTPAGALAAQCAREVSAAR